MFVPSMMQGLASVIVVICNFLQILILASVIVSWVNADPSNPIVSMIRAITEPMYKPFRSFLRFLPGPIDWAPLVLILIIIFVKNGIVPYLQKIGY